VIDEYALILVLFAIYISECIFSPSRDASLFRRSMRGHWVATSRTSQATFKYRLVVENLLPRQGSILVAEPAPPLIGPSGICCVQKRTETQVANCITFTEAGPFISKDCVVSSGSMFVCSLATATQAEHVAELLTTAKASNTTERDSLITHFFHQMLDTRRAVRRWKAFKKASRLLSVSSWALFGTLMALSIMLVLLRFQFAAAWPLTVVILVFLPRTVFLFYRIHIIFFRDKSSERWKQIALMLLTPPTAIRAGDLMAREIFSGFHSLAVPQGSPKSGQ